MTKRRLRLLRECTNLAPTWNQIHVKGSAEAEVDDNDLVQAGDTLVAAVYNTEHANCTLSLHDVQTIRHSPVSSAVVIDDGFVYSWEDLFAGNIVEGTLGGTSSGIPMPVSTPDSHPLDHDSMVTTIVEFSTATSWMQEPGINPLPIGLDVNPSGSHPAADFNPLNDPVFAVDPPPSQAANKAQCQSPESPSSSPVTDPSKDSGHRNDRSLVPARIQSCRSSIPSLTSLGRRLSLKYSESCLGDIISVMRRLSISSKASEKRKRFDSFMKPKIFGSSVPTSNNLPEFEERDEESIGPKIKDHSVILPGVFSMFCWEELKRDQLRPCPHRQQKFGEWPYCRPPGSEMDGAFPSELISDILRGTVRRGSVNSVDPFGNSVLHVAAALSSSPKYLLHLLELGPNINAVNNAGETFLHLVPYVQAMNYDDMRFLLNKLKRDGFNFCLRDHHGQTPLHSLTRPWKLYGAIVATIINDLRFPRLFSQTARDNLGITVAQRAGPGFSGILSPGTTRECTSRTKMFSKTSEYLDDHESINSFVQLDEPCLPNYRKHFSIETVEDLHSYEQHADLLRTILKACTGQPQYEDSSGRSGLHCLAEVSLDLPVPAASILSPTDGNAGNQQTPRERYLEDLLRAGVDPDNHDKRGDTPLIACIRHVRVGEDDATTTRILARLYDAGADISRRNRDGETPLHIAVKLGRRAATMFLLSRGANVHARSKIGKGVLALGLEYSKRAGTDEILYAQIMLCIALAASAGAETYPTLLQQWASPRWKIVNN
jgi:ankyrin repeat protein